MAEDDTERLRALSQSGICPYCKRTIPAGNEVGDGNHSNGRFCSLDCYAAYHEHELIERHLRRLNDAPKATDNNDPD